MTSGLVVWNNPSGIADKTLEQSCVSRLNCYSAQRNAVSRISNPWTYCAHFSSKFIGWVKTNSAIFLAKTTCSALPHCHQACSSIQPGSSENDMSLTKTLWAWFCTYHPGDPLLEALMDNCPPLFESNNLWKASRSCKSSLEMTNI